MQKKSNFVKINKTLAAIGTLVVLIPSIFAADLFSATENWDKNEENISDSSMYKQLDSYMPEKKESKDELIKMNNSEIKNANGVTAVAAENEICTAFSGNVSVLCAETGTVCGMELDDYVLCALIAEMPQSFDVEALKAQAVAIRTYTVRCVLGASKHDGADVCSDHRCCQSMIPKEQMGFDVSKAEYAVKATKGIIAVYEGQPILAAYHSSSYETTKSSEAVWGGEVDYLVPVFAPEDKAVSAYTVSLDNKKVKSVLKQNGLEDDWAFEFNEKGICICAYDGENKLAASEISKLLGLRSDSFTVADNGDTYVFTTYGFGHGVGMSQYGADALAKDGYSFYEILKYYYTGISFAFLE